ncbi:MAG TPA: FAD:protein FMN transferase [Gemmatimonadaceae bacterium]|nr:FAD:protein FMN transferase [Gemmatimonadaceae bacterium]
MTVAGALLTASATVLPAQVRSEFTEVHMGVPVRIVVHAVDDSVAREAARAAYARIADLEDKMSDYRAESEVRRLAGRSAEWRTVSAELFAVLARALEVARASDGAFDPTVGPLVALWRQTRRDGRLPSDAALQRARARVDWRLVALDTSRRAVRFAADSMRLDLGGIAKGYIIQEGLEAMRRHGVPSALVAAGGDIVVGDAPPGRRGWTVTIAGRDTVLTGVAVATSGPTEQFVEIGGVRYSHVIDTRTGLGAVYTERALVVTVIASDGATADAVATAASIPGRTPGRRLRELTGVRRIVLTHVQLPASREQPGTPRSPDRRRDR